MDVTGQNESDKNDHEDKDHGDKKAAAPKPHSTVRRPDDVAAETQINLVSPFAHPRGFRQFIARHPIPVALSCLALGGTIAAVILKRRRRDTWDARIDRLRQALVDAANGAG